MNHHVAVIPAPNICEVSTVGSIYALAALFFVPWKEAVLAEHASRTGGCFCASAPDWR